MRACQIQSAGACWLRASLRTAPSSRLSCGALALTCLGITLLLPLRNTPTSYCSPFEERSTREQGKAELPTPPHRIQTRLVPECSLLRARSCRSKTAPHPHDQEQSYQPLVSSLGVPGRDRSL